MEPLNAIKEGGKVEKEEFVYKFDKIGFPSLTTDTFRATMTSTTTGTTFWLESKQSKKQWQSTIADVRACGNAGIPEDAIVEFLKRAFELIVEEPVNEPKKVPAADDPSIDLSLRNGAATLTLALSMLGVWKPRFEFTLQPVGLGQIEILEARLRDAQEEIALSRQVKFLSLSALKSELSSLRRVVSWNGTAPRVIDDCFSVSADNTQVVIRSKGVYQVKFRLHNYKVQINDYNPPLHSQVQVNSVDTECAGFEWAELILRLSSNDAVQVALPTHASYSVSYSGGLLSILRLGD